MVQPDALAHIMTRDDPQGYARRLADSGAELPLSLGMDFLTAFEAGSLPAPGPKQTGLEGSAPAAERFVHVRSESPSTAGAAEDAGCAVMLRNRLSVLRAELAKRPSLSGASTLDRIPLPQKRAALVGLVQSIRPTRNGAVMLCLEDETGTVNVIASGERGGPGASVLEDEVIGVVGRVQDRGLVIADEILYPEPAPSMPPQAGAGAVALASDLHWGNPAFMRERWDDFLRAVSERSGQLGIRALILCGDLVDARHLSRQVIEGRFAGGADPVIEAYSELGLSLAVLPESVELVVMPGDHDAVRASQPQPPLPDVLRAAFPTRTVFVPNPVLMELGGVPVLAYHGQGAELYARCAHPDERTSPVQLMREMLRRRHLSPTLGCDIPLAPDLRDHMAVETVPRVMFMGHLHFGGSGTYRDTALVGVPPMANLPLPLSLAGEPAAPGSGILFELGPMRASPFP